MMYLCNDILKLLFFLYPMSIYYTETVCTGIKFKYIEQDNK